MSRSLCRRGFPEQPAPHAGSLDCSAAAALCGERGRAVACTSGCWSASRHHATEPATSPAGLCGKKGGRLGVPRMAASGFLSGLIDQQRGPAFRQQPTRTPPTGTHTKLYVPPTRTASSRPRNAELLAGREGGQRQQMAAATVLGVILAWFVLGQMAELNGLLACLSRILFIWKSQSPGKQQVVAQRGYSGIRRLLDERVLFCSVIWHPCTGCKCLCVAECVCVCVCLCHS